MMQVTLEDVLGMPPKPPDPHAERKAKRREKYRAKKKAERAARQPNPYWEVPLEQRYAKDADGTLLLVGKAWKTTNGKADKLGPDPKWAVDAPIVVLTIYVFVVFRSTYQLKDERNVRFTLKRQVLARFVYPREEVTDAQEVLTALADMEVRLKMNRAWRWLPDKQVWPEMRGFGVWS
jgi:hypothetical protein